MNKIATHIAVVGLGTTPKDFPDFGQNGEQQLLIEQERERCVEDGGRNWGEELDGRISIDDNGNGNGTSNNGVEHATRDPMSRIYAAEILDVYPGFDQEGDRDTPNSDYVPFNTDIWLFAMPMGIHLSEQATPPRYHPFVLTDSDGSRRYGGALTFDEPLPAQMLSNYGVFSTSSVFAPKSILILSNHGYYEGLRDILLSLFSYFPSGYGEKIPFERMVQRIVCEVPAPPPDCRLLFKIGQKAISITQPPTHDMPLLSVSLRPLFESLCVHDVLKVISCLLLEGRVVLITEQSLSLLVVAAEALKSLMYPFPFLHTYVPVLPEPMRDAILAPTPFLLGLHRSYADPSALREADTAVVDLDRGLVALPLGWRMPELPEPERSILYSRLDMLLSPSIPRSDEVNWIQFQSEHGGDGDGDGNGMSHMSMSWNSDASSGNSGLGKAGPCTSMFDLEVRRAFLTFYASLFGTFRRYLIYLQGDPVPIVMFNRRTFLNARIAGSSNINANLNVNGEGEAIDDPFLEAFLQTQSFTSFIEDRASAGFDRRADLFERISYHIHNHAQSEKEEREREKEKDKDGKEEEEKEEKNDTNKRTHVQHLMQRIKRDRSRSATASPSSDLGEPMSLSGVGGYVNVNVNVNRARTGSVDASSTTGLIYNYNINDDAAKTYINCVPSDEWRRLQRYYVRTSDDSYFTLGRTLLIPPPPMVISKSEGEGEGGHRGFVPFKLDLFAENVRMLAFESGGQGRKDDPHSHTLPLMSPPRVSSLSHRSRKLQPIARRPKTRESTSLSLQQDTAADDYINERLNKLLGLHTALSLSDLDQLTTMAAYPLGAQRLARILRANAEDTQGGKLETDVFDQLVQICDSLMKNYVPIRKDASTASASTSTTSNASDVSAVSKIQRHQRHPSNGIDYTVPKAILKVGAIFYKHTATGLPEFVYSKMTEYDVWRMTPFWTDAFIEDLGAERRRLKAEAVDANRRSRADLTLTETIEDVVQREENIIFALLGHFIFNQLNIGLKSADVKTFVKKMCHVNALSGEMTDTILVLVSNMARLQTIDSQVDDDADVPESPSNRRSIRVPSPPPPHKSKTKQVVIEGEGEAQAQTRTARVKTVAVSAGEDQHQRNKGHHALTTAAATATRARRGSVLIDAPRHISMQNKGRGHNGDSGGDSGKAHRTSWFGTIADAGIRRKGAIEDKFLSIVLPGRDHGSGNGSGNSDRVLRNRRRRDVDRQRRKTVVSFADLRFDRALGIESVEGGEEDADVKEKGEEEEAEVITRQRSGRTPVKMTAAAAVRSRLRSGSQSPTSPRSGGDSSDGGGGGGGSARVHSVNLRRCSNPACSNLESVPYQFLQCSGCMSETYCGRSCQLHHWTVGEHQKNCHPPKSSPKAKAKAKGKLRKSSSKVKVKDEESEGDDDKGNKNVGSPMMNLARKLARSKSRGL